MAAGGGLKRIGVPFSSCYGIIDKDPQTVKWLMSILKFYKARADAATDVKEAISRLGEQKFLALGGMSLKMPTTTADVDQWQKLYGISYEALGQSEMKVRALKMVDWKGVPGESDYTIKDARLKDAVDFLWGKKQGKFDFSRPKFENINKLVYQLSFYYATMDLCQEYSITFGGIDCQDEISARDCTVCMVTAYLNNDVGPTAKRSPSPYRLRKRYGLRPYPAIEAYPCSIKRLDGGIFYQGFQPEPSSEPCWEGLGLWRLLCRLPPEDCV